MINEILRATSSPDADGGVLGSADNGPMPPRAEPQRSELAIPDAVLDEIEKNE